MSFNCLICIEGIGSKETVVSTNCGHVFHQYCLTSWLEKSKTCPQCRTEMTTEFHKLFMDADPSLETELEKANTTIKDLQEKNCDKEVVMKTLQKDIEEKDELISGLCKKLELLELMNQSKNNQIESLESIISSSAMGEAQQNILENHRIAGHKVSYAEALRKKQ